MANGTKAELEAENAKLLRRVATLERAKKKSAAQAQEIKDLRAKHLEAEQREAATAGILKVIANSPSDAQPVFDAIAKSAMRLLGGQSAAVTRVVDGMVHLAAITSTGKEGNKALRAIFPVPVSHPISRHARVARTGEPTFRSDYESDPDVKPQGLAMARARGFRSDLVVPLLLNGEPIGGLSVARREPGTFSKQQINLLESFAAQAVIAIENVRLFNETKEALERQTATAGILKVISESPTSVQPVFDAITNSAAQLFAPCVTGIMMREADQLFLRSLAGPANVDVQALEELYPIPFDPAASIVARAIDSSSFVETLDTEAPDSPDLARAVGRAIGFRSFTVAPLLRSGGGIGAITISSPQAGFRLSDKQLSLLKTFADQAVIAIENVRLFNETKESLERQTATAEILRVIASSPEDVQPVFDSIVRTCRHLFGGQSVALALLEGGKIGPKAGVDEHGIPMNLESLPPWDLDRGSATGAAVLDARPVNLADLADSVATFPRMKDLALRIGYQSGLWVPLIREGGAIGVLNVLRRTTGSFTDQEVALLQTFADQAVIAIENVRLFNETKEALERQTATAEILKVISSSPTDVQPVFDAIVASAARLFHPHSAGIVMRDGDVIQLRGAAGPDITNASLDAVKALYPVPFDPETMFSARVISEAQVLEVPDTEAVGVFPLARKVGRAGGFRSSLYVPLVREGMGIGAIVLTHPNPGTKLTDKQFALLQTFADQAVIAIENVRLFNETKEALEQQTATADVLQVISSSPNDLRPIFDAVLRNATTLCDAHLGILNLFDGKHFLTAAQRGGNPEFVKWLFERGPWLPAPNSTVERMVAERRPMQVADARDSRAYREGKGNPIAAMMVDVGGARTFLTVPLMKEGKVIGNIGIYRPEVREFTERQVELVQTFANQAAIAIENVRLFNETKEALEHQRASAEILAVISSSMDDTKPVFDKIADSAAQLFSGRHVGVVLLGQDGMLHLGAHRGPSADEFSRHFPVAPVPGGSADIVISGRRAVQYADVFSDPGVPASLRAACEITGAKAVMQCPMISKGTGIGMLYVARERVGAFSDKEMALLKTFADQAVIAIENVRLFNETKESLERQTATAEILKVIASSPSDVQPVFDAIAQRAVRLIDGLSAAVTRVEGNMLELQAFTTTSESGDEALRNMFPIPIHSGNGTNPKAVRNKAPSFTSDVLTDPESSPAYREAARARGFRGALAVPMLGRDGAAIGSISVTRREAGPFPEHQISLLKTFADQAVIAIENVRLFNETKEALERQTATAEILKVIARTPDSVQPVFDAIVESCLPLFGGMSVALFLKRGDLLDRVAFSLSPDAKDEASDMFPTPLQRGGTSSRAILTRQVVQVTDVMSEAGVSEKSRAIAQRMGFRSIMAAPLLRDGEALGTINVFRAAPAAFSAQQVALLQTFADQAVIAIENVRMFNETKEALERQQTSAEILRVISESIADANPVFEVIVAACARLFKGHQIGINLVDDTGRVRLAACEGPNREALHRYFREEVENEQTTVMRLKGGVAHYPDVEQEDVPAKVRNAGRVWGTRAIVYAAMISGGRGIGAIWVARNLVGPFSDREISLLQNFADQAVIAIQNARLFKELESRTAALSQSVGQLTALGEVGQAISSTLDLDTVLKTIVSRANQLTGLDGGAIYEYDPDRQEFRLQISENMADEIVQIARKEPIRLGNGAVGRTGVTREPTQVPDTLADSYNSDRKETLIRAGYRAVLAVPLLREDNLLGALLVTRKTPGPFAEDTVALLKTFATQSAMAIQNARLFREIAEKGKQLETASRHKSDFLASMSHELRTPLNAILGFNELILAEIYGAVPEDMKVPLADIQSSGKHLLRLINNVLDLAKIEAGRMELALADYSVHDTVESVRATLRPLAAEKGLEFHAVVPEEIPLAFGDYGRITQCLMNLAGNSLKFTKEGKVEIVVALNEGILVYRVNDTGIGIPPDKIGNLFTEFKQTDATIASEYGGTGLGLSISKKFIEMHGGRIWIESELGKGSSFIFEVPLRVEVIGEAES